MKGVLYICILLLLSTPLSAQLTKDGLLNKFEQLKSTPADSINFQIIGLEKIIRELDEDKNIDLVAEAFYTKGYLFYRSQRYQEGLKWFEMSGTYFKDAKDQNGVAKAANALATSYNQLGIYDKAIANYEVAMNVNRELRDSSGYAKTLNNLGDVLRKVNKLQLSLNMLLEAKKVNTQQRDTAGLSAVFNNLGLTYFALQQYDSALLSYERSLNLKQVLNQKSGVANAYNNMAMVFKALNESSLELTYLQKALDLRTELNDKVGVLSLMVNISDYHLRNGNTSLAYTLALDSRNKADEQERNDLKLRAYQQLYLVYKALNNNEQALLTYEKCVEIKDKVFSEQTASEIANLELLIDKQKIQAENDLLRKQQEYSNLIEQQQLLFRNGLITLVTLLMILLIVILTRYKRVKKLNKAISESEDRFKLLANTPFVGVLLVENDSIVDCNQEFLRIISQTQDKVLGQAVNRFIQKDKVDGQVIYKLESPIKGSIDVQLYERTAEKDGREIRIIALSDVSKLRQFEQELVQARLNAEKLSTAKSQFLANMSHELRTPLNGIIAGLQLFEKEKFSAEGQELLSIVKSSADHLLNIINDILDLTKVEAGKLDIQLTPLNLGELTREIFEMMRIKHNNPNVKLGVQTTGEVHQFVYGDALRIKQVMTNLLSNALKFTEKGHITMRVVTKNYGNSGLEVLFEVEDSGIGIKTEDKAKIFDVFTQGDFTLSKRHGGTGLGLSISKKLIQMMGGDLEFESEYGSGSKFYFVLKMRKASSPTGASDSENIDIVQSGQRSQVKVLLAEDNKMNQKLVEIYFRRAGVEMDLAEDGQQAIDKFESSQYSMIFMDVQMPVKDGLEASRTIRRIERQKGLKHTPIVALTANAMKGDKEKCLEAGMDDFISKPFKKEEIQQVLEKYIFSTDTFLNQTGETL